MNRPLDGADRRFDLSQTRNLRELGTLAILANIQPEILLFCLAGRIFRGSAAGCSRRWTRVRYSADNLVMLADPANVGSVSREHRRLDQQLKDLNQPPDPPFVPPPGSLDSS